MSRGRHANHLYLDVGAPADPHAATTPNVINPATSVEILERIITTEGAKPVVLELSPGAYFSKTPQIVVSWGPNPTPQS